MVAVAVSAWVQGSVGFGYALVSAPLLALIAPDFVPGPILLSSLVLVAVLLSVSGLRLASSTLAVVGHFGAREFTSGLLLLPATGLGFALSGASRRYLDEGRTRPAVLTVASISAVAVVIKTLCF